MFSARCCQNAKKTYEKMKSAMAIIMTIAAIVDMTSIRELSCCAGVSVLLSVNATATLPMTSEIEGSMAPAIIALIVPTNSRSLSKPVRKVKNFVNGMERGASSGS